MPDQCAGLNFNCPACGRHFHAAERVPKCPDCGTDLRCGKPPVVGYRYCERHGGPAPSRNFYGKGRAIVTGQESSFPIVQLSAKYREMTQNGLILSNRASMEVLDKRIAQLLDRLENGNFPNQLMDLRELWVELLPYLVGIPLDGQKTKHALNARFEAVYHDYMAFTQIQSVMETRRKMSETEVKIAKELHSIITAEDAYKLMAQLLASITTAVQQEPEIKSNVKSHLLKRIVYEFTRIIGEGSGDESGGEPLRGFGEVVDAGSGELD